MDLKASICRRRGVTRILTWFLLEKLDPFAQEGNVEKDLI